MFDFVFRPRMANALNPSPTRRKSRLRAATIFTPEFLEARMVMAGQPVITEIVADSTKGLKDEDGNRTDWLEIYNAGDQAVDLGGWFLTDDQQQLTKWQFPATELAPHRYLVIHASGKDRRVPGQPLHANFQLSLEGEYVALVRPDGHTIAHEYAPSYPVLSSDVSYGLPTASLITPLVDAKQAAKYLLPLAGTGAETYRTAWVDMNFDDASWTDGTADVGFDTQPDFLPYFTTDLRATMQSNSAGVYVRSTFQLNEVPQQIFDFALRMRYDDGFIAYLNGVEIARRNVPQVTEYNSASSASHSDTAAIVYEDISLNAYTNLLRVGKNVLAIHGLNASTGNNDFLISPQLRILEPGPITNNTPGFLPTVTPGEPNGETVYSGIISAPSVTPERGFFVDPVDVTIHNPVPGALVTYTTDGSEPTATHGAHLFEPNATTDTASLRIDRTTTLRVGAFRDGYRTLAIGTHSYIFPNDVASQTYESIVSAGYPAKWTTFDADYGIDPDIVGPNDKFNGVFAAQFVDSLLALPTLSIVLDRDDLFSPVDGLYVFPTRTGSDFERPTSVELIYPNGDDGFQVDAGIRIQGGASREHASSKKKSFRLEFRGQYGPTELEYPFFGPDAVDQFDTITLRANYNDSFVHTPETTQYVRDQFLRETLLNMGQVASHGRYMHVYINGYYWGMYNPVERPEATFSAAYFGGDADNWDAINVTTAIDGTTGAWLRVRNAARAVNNTDPALSNAAYLAIQGRNPDGTKSDTIEHLVDVDNYIDYMIANLYGGNTDWPHKNFYVAREQGPNSTGFKFYSWDAEKILDHGEGSDINTNQTTVRDGVAQAYDNLRRNAEFRLQFADHVQRHFFNGGSLYVDPNQPAWDPDHPERNVPAARFAKLANEVELPLVAESARWGDEKGNATPITVNTWRKERDKILTDYLPRRSAIVLGQFRKLGLFPSYDAPRFNQHGGVVDDNFALTIDGEGTIYYTLDGSDPRVSPLTFGGTEAKLNDQAHAYASAIPLQGHVTVKARALKNGEWSALTEAEFTTVANGLRITEIMYHPQPVPNGSTFTTEDFEFVEITNTTSRSVHTDGVQFSNGLTFAFPNGDLAPGERAVVVANQRAFQERYGTTIRILGEYGSTGSSLSNGGETLEIADALGTVIHTLQYDDGWFALTDGRGASLEAIDMTASGPIWSTSSQWHASLLVDGTPGRDAGDLDRDGQIGVADLDLAATQVRSHTANFDVNGDGEIDTRDYTQIVTAIQHQTLGDSNLDGVFDSDDLVTLFQAGTYENQRGTPASWLTGDWNGDGLFTSQDIVVAMQFGALTLKPIVGAELTDAALASWESNDNE